MLVRPRHVPSFLAGLALVLAASVAVAMMIEWRTQAADLRWSPRLWVSGCVVALVALLAGLVADRRGFSIPLALLDLLVLLALGGVFFLLALGSTP